MDYERNIVKLTLNLSNGNTIDVYHKTKEMISNKIFEEFLGLETGKAVYLSFRKSRFEYSIVKKEDIVYITLDCLNIYTEEEILCN